MLKSCSYCGKIHDSKYICPEREEALKKRHGKKKYKSKYDVFKDTNVNNFRNTKAWQDKRNEIRQRDHNLCQICIRERYHTIKILNHESLSVHHNVPLIEDYDKRLENGNLLTVCEYHHRLCDNGTILQREVQEIIDEQEGKKIC